MCINICFSVFFFGFVNQSVKSKTPYIYLEHATVVTFTGSLSLILRAVQVSRVCGMLLLSHNILNKSTGHGIKNYFNIRGTFFCASQAFETFVLKFSLLANI